MLLLACYAMPGTEMAAMPLRGVRTHTLTRHTQIAYGASSAGTETAYGRSQTRAGVQLAPGMRLFGFDSAGCYCPTPPIRTDVGMGLRRV
eukprot:626871-Rhodomonas_salina.3